MTTKQTQTIAVLAAGWIVSAAAAQVIVDPVIRKPFTADPALAAQALRQIQPHEIAFRVTHAALNATRPGDRIAFDGLIDSLDAVIERIERRSESSYSLFGRVGDDPESILVLTVLEDAVVGVIQQPLSGLEFKVRYAGAGVQTLIPVAAEDRAEGCNTEIAGAGRAAANPAAPLDPRPSAAPAPPARDGTLGACNPPRRRLDLLMYYTVAAAGANGGSSGAAALCQTGVDLANQAYIDSGISARMYLLDARQTTYVESGDLETDRDRLQDDNDGFLDFAHPGRDEAGADVVCLMVAESDPVNAGIAFCTPNVNHAFCVIEEDDVDNGQQVLAHEIGHLQGCAHNHGDAGSGCNEFCYSFGHRFIGISGAGWRTIMAYDDAGNNFPNPVGRFSNPGQTWDGVPLGVDTFPCGVFPSNDDADNARSIDGTAAEVEEWRDPKFQVWVEKNYSGTERGTWWEPWSTINEGVTAIYAGSNAPLITPVLKVKAETYTATPRITKTMRIEACGGTVRIGG